jgi:hypothetical protein
LKQKEPFKRINVADIKRNKEIDALIANLNEQVQKEAEQLAQELVEAGYNVDDFELGIDSKVDDGKYKVTISVVQVGKYIEYDLGGEK